MSLLVSLFGADGSGKTTLARLVNQYLVKHDTSNTIVWMRGTHTLASILARILSHSNTFRGLCNPYYNICIPPRMKRLWLWLEFISIIPIIFTRLIIPKLFYRVVIAERSLIDFLVWLIITLRWSSILNSIIGRFIISLTYSICDKIIYIRADLDTLINRRSSDESYLISIQLRIYDAIAKYLKIPYIDTSRKPIHESLRELLRIIGVGNV